MAFETIATVSQGEIRVSLPGYAEGESVRVIVPEEPRLRMVGDMTREEFRAWFVGIVRDGFDVEEPPDPPPEPVEEW